MPVLPTDTAPAAPALPAVPDLADQGGLLNNPLYFNFVLYILWKAALVYLPDDTARYARNSAVQHTHDRWPLTRSNMLQMAGRNLAQLAVPDCIHSAEQAAAGVVYLMFVTSVSTSVLTIGGGGRATTSALLKCMDGALRRLQAGGYLQAYEILWAVAGAS